MLKNLLPTISDREYLEFGNAVLFGMALCAIIVFTDLLLLKLRILYYQKGWRGIWRLARDYVVEDRPFEAELTVSVYIIFVAICGRTFMIWRWRDEGALSKLFPLTGVAIFDLLLVIGFACVIRISARTDPQNWPWIASVLLSLLLGWYTVKF